MPKDSDQFDSEVDLGPLPRYKKRRRRPPEDRGLPPDDELMRLAEAYLITQGKLWPELVTAGLLAKPRADILVELVEDFKTRHRTGDVNMALVRPLIDRKLKLAGNYDRYSSDNSNAHSIIDQMVNSLEKARSESRFIPWTYVFADYAVSGLDPGRRGYTSYKLVLESPELQVDTTYIDDFTRASRDDIEWWRLANASRRLRKRLIGASDGFDLFSPQGEMMMYVYLLVSRFFIKQAKEKSKRGMRAAARRRTVLGKLPLGLTRRAKRRDDGTVERNAHGRPFHVPCHDPVTMDAARHMFELFVVQKWSRGRIAKLFNQLKVDDWDGWSPSGIRDTLANPAYVGVFIWNQTRLEYDEEKEKKVVVRNPPSEWIVEIDRSLALVPTEIWKAARRRLGGGRRKGNRAPRSRNQNCASTLFSGTLHCEYCGHEITLNRSAGAFKSMFCVNGPHRSHGCKLTSCKSTRIIEKCLLKYLQDVLLTEDAVTALVGKANAYLKKEAARPRTDTTPLKNKVREKEALIKKLFARLGKAKDEDLCSAYEQQIAQLKREVKKLNGELQDHNVNNAAPPKPLKLKDVRRYVSDLRSVLNQEIPAAADAIRTLTGPIKIRQEPIPGRKVGARWIATFSPDLTKLLAKIARQGDYPDSITLEFLSWRNWIVPNEIVVVIHDVPKYEEQAPIFLEMKKAGASINAIASAHRISGNYVKEILRFAETGERPDWTAAKSRKSKGGRRPSTAGDSAAGRSAVGAPQRIPKYQEIAQEVVRLHDCEGMSFETIRILFEVGRHTVARAYDFARPEHAHSALRDGKCPDRGKVSIIGLQKYLEIRRMLAEGKSAAETAKAVGCGKSTVYRERARRKRAT